MHTGFWGSVPQDGWVVQRNRVTSYPLPLPSLSSVTLEKECTFCLPSIWWPYHSWQGGLRKGAGESAHLKRPGVKAWGRERGILLQSQSERFHNQETTCWSFSKKLLSSEISSPLVFPSPPASGFLLQVGWVERGHPEKQAEVAFRWWAAQCSLSWVCKLHFSLFQAMFYY